MKNLSRTRKYFLGAAILACVVIYHHKKNSTPAQTPAKITAQETTIAQKGSDEKENIAQRTDNSILHTENSRNPKVPTALLNRYNDGQNMRAFVENALQHPEQGGYFYASKVLKQCRGYVTGTDIESGAAKTYPAGEDSGKFQQAANAAERLRMRCADFLAEETSYKRSADIWKNGRYTDPLIAAIENYDSAYTESKKSTGNAAIRTQALQNLLLLGDPLAIEEINLRLNLQVENGKTGFLLDHTFHDLNSETDVGAAIYLLPCSIGLVCDEKEFDVSVRCASGGECVGSRFEYIQKMVETLPGAYERIITAYDAMRTAVADGNAQFFNRR